MKVGMKNSLELMDDTHEYYDFALNEECHEYNECEVCMYVRSMGSSPRTSAPISFACCGHS